MWPWTLLCLAALGATLLVDRLGHRRWRALTKGLASTGFVGAALAAGATHSTYGLALLAALCLSWVGDVVLAGEGSLAFLAGLGAFLLGHVGFGLAFLLRGVSPAGLGLGAALVVLPAIATYRWLDPHVTGRMRKPVIAYLCVISSMVALCVGTVWGQGGALLLPAAVLFFLSDLLVAREKFVHSTFGNRVVGLTLYYVAQLLFAATLLG